MYNERQNKCQVSTFETCSYWRYKAQKRIIIMREWEQHRTNRWVRSFYVSAYAYAYVAGVLTWLCLCYADACAYAYALVSTSLWPDSENCRNFILYLVRARHLKIRSVIANSFTIGFTVHPNFFSFILCLYKRERGIKACYLYFTLL